MGAFNGFNLRLAAAKSDISIAAIKHGHLRPKGIKCVGKKSGRAYTNGSYRHLLFDFLSLDTTPIPVKEVKQGLTLSHCVELLYVSLEKARDMIDKECQVPLGGTPKDHCKNKTVFVLGTGDPGLGPESSFTNADSHFPEGLRDRLVRDNITVHTVCFSSRCNLKLWNCPYSITHDGKSYREYSQAGCLSGGTELTITGLSIMDYLATETGGNSYIVR